MRCRLFMLALALLPGLAGAQQPQHFAFVGELTHLVAEGVPVAHEARGIPFDITLTRHGDTITGPDKDLRGAGGAVQLRVALENATYRNNQLSALVHLLNAGGTAVEGVRLDITGSSEVFTASDMARVRQPPVNQASPLSFGDIREGEENGGIPLLVTGVKLTPETTSFTLHGVVSGVAYLTTRATPNQSCGGEIEVTPAGDLLMADTTGNRLMRCEPDGSRPRTAAVLPDRCRGMAVDPRNGSIAATCMGQRLVFTFSAGGDAEGPTGDPQIIQGYAGFVRFDRNGAVWLVSGSDLIHFGGIQPPIIIAGAPGGVPIDPDTRFDVAPNGILCVVAGPSLYTVSPDGRTASKLTGAPGWEPGRLTNPACPRVDPDGDIWVVERESGTLPPRISIFTLDGGLVRVLGRGSKTPPQHYPDLKYAAQLLSPYDVAFGSGNRVYISSGPGAGGSSQFMVMQRF